MLLVALGCGLFLGWALGANDSANVFGTAVAARVLSFRRAVLLCGAAVVLGAVLEGHRGIATYRGLAEQDMSTVVMTAFAAGFTVTVMTMLRLPVSTSQAMVGAIAGIGLATRTMNWEGLQKVVICWLATPLGAMLIAWAVYRLLGLIMERARMSMLTRDKVLWSGLIVMGAYGAYALGANNVANATGVLSGQFDTAYMSDRYLALYGALAIALGAATFSKRVMLAVGSGIMPLDAFTGFTAVTAMAITIHVFAMVGVPVSASQAIVGAIIGVGLVRQAQSLRWRVLRRIAFGWVMTPVTALVLAAAAYAIFYR